MVDISKLSVGILIAGILATLGNAAHAEDVVISERSGGELSQAEPSTPIEGDTLLEYRPPSSLPKSFVHGDSAHTHLRVFLPPDGREVTPISPSKARAFRSSGGANAQKAPAYIVNTPSSIACLYELVPQTANEVPGCNPAHTTVNPTGGTGAIALVDAYDDPTAAADIAYFSKYFELPGASFQVVYAGGAYPYTTGPKPASGVQSGWNMEASLDIEWAHAMAPHAKIFLVEAQNSSISSLLVAVEAAANLVASNGGGEVSMSWGDAEFQTETSYDLAFSTAPTDVAFFAATGDTGGDVEWPAASPDVVGVGGTTINTTNAGAFAGETTWTSGGGGLSYFEPRPAFQNATLVENVVGPNRGTPDLSFDANPSSGVAVYVSGGWYLFGGTSVAAPSTAGIFNVASAGAFVSSPALLSTLYENAGNTSEFRDIVKGGCGALIAKSGFDLCTGLGSPLTYLGK